MFPTIKTGDLLLYKKVTKAEEIREGQIVVFVPRTVMAGLSFEKFICHRFLKIEEGRMITKGEKNKQYKSEDAQVLFIDHYRYYAADAGNNEQV